MRIYITYIFLLLTILVSAQSLTIQECRDMAIENNRNIQMSELKRLMAEKTLSAYKTNYLPKFSVKGSYIYSNSKPELFIDGGYLPTFIPNPQTGALEPNIIGTAPDGSPIFGSYALMPEMNFKMEIGSVYSAGAYVEQPIYMGGKINSSVKMAEQGVRIALLEYEKDEKIVIEKTDDAFWTLIKVEELLKSAAKYKEVVTEFYRQMNNAFEIGMKTGNDLQKVRVRVNEAELKYRQAQNGVKLARMNLCYYVGLPLNNETVNVTESENDFNNIDIAELESDITKRPEYEMLLSQIEYKKQNVKFVRSDFMPQLTAMASYSYAHGVKLIDSHLLNNASFFGGVNLNIPIFNWGEGGKKVSAAKYELQIAQKQLEEVSDLMQLELLKSSNEFDEATLEVALTATALEQSEINLKMSRDQYDVGLETIADYLEAQAIWQNAMSDHINAKARQRIAYTVYLKAAGLL